MNMQKANIVLSRKAAIILVLLILGGCASSRAPVEDVNAGLPSGETRQASEFQENGGLQGQPLLPSESWGGQPLSAQRSTPPVVAKLLRQSDQAGQQQDWPKAESYLQRALRISPKNAVLWSRMAEAKLKQGKSAQAVQFASKSNAISSDPSLRAKNAAIIESAGK